MLISWQPQILKFLVYIHSLIYAIALFIYTIQAVHRQNVTAFGGD
ncbi:MAG: hypothetical protein RM338_02645 [Nostoc sp. DedQUE12a]|nr:hypothetical protein [Nostoc sp. DedQUE12a]